MYSWYCTYWRDFRNGFGDLVSKIQSLPGNEKAEIESAIKDIYKNQADLALRTPRKQ